MALGKAIRFIRLVKKDPELRENCSRLSSKQELYRVLDFDIHDFNEAFDTELVKCQTTGEAEELYQVREWFKMI